MINLDANKGYQYDGDSGDGRSPELILTNFRILKKLLSFYIPDHGFRSGSE